MKRQGFTLVEAIIYTALVGIVVTGFISFLLIIVSVRSKNKVINNTNIASRQAAQYIEDTIVFAGSIISPSLGTASAAVAIINQAGQTVTISQVSDALWAETENEIIQLTGNNVIVTNTIFSRLNNESIGFSFTVSGESSGSREYESTLSYRSAATINPP